MSTLQLQALSPISVDRGDVMDLHCPPAPAHPRPLKYSANTQSCIVDLTRCQNPVNTCPSDAAGMDGRMQWEQGDEDRVRMGGRGGGSVEMDK